MFPAIQYSLFLIPVVYTFGCLHLGGYQHTVYMMYSTCTYNEKQKFGLIKFMYGERVTTGNRSDSSLNVILLYVTSMLRRSTSLTNIYIYDNRN